MAKLSLKSTITLRSGLQMPRLGLGTYQMNGREAYNSVLYALQVGYRHIDTAAWYENEKECGQAIIDFCSSTSTPRSEIFYTTKLRSNRGKAATKSAIQASLDACKLGYIDLYLVHSPLGGPQKRMDSWEAILEAQKEGKLKSIGVSNYGVRHLKELIDSGHPLPEVNQIDLHPFMTRNDIVSLCEEHQIVLQAWAPLVQGMKHNDSTLVRVAKAHNKTVPQVLLRWSLQRNFAPVPKSTKKDRILSNADLYDFELTEEEVEILNSLDEYLVTDWDPTNTP